MDLLPLCAPKHVRALTNTAPGWKGNDDKFAQFIPLASSQVRAFCRRTFAIETRREFFTSPNGYATSNKLKLIEAPLVAGKPFLVEYSPTGNFSTGNAEVIPAAYLDVDTERAEITIIDGFYQFARKGIRVTYDAGYEEAQADGTSYLDVPSEITQATALQCAFMMSKATAGTLGKTSIAQNQGVSENYDRGGLTGLIREASGPLLPYRRTFVGRT